MASDGRPAIALGLMQIINEQTAPAFAGERTVITIGAYDGVHLGHQAVISHVRQRALELGARSAVVTFDRHPASVVRPESAPLLLTGPEQKMDCHLYPSDAADDLLCVDLGARRIIKKKNTQKKHTNITTRIHNIYL